MTAVGSPTSQVIELDADFPAQDFLVIGGDKSPGKCEISNTHSPRPWDIRQGYALSGATLVPKGDEPATFAIRFSLWLPSQVPGWYAFAAKYFDKSVRLVPGTLTPKALTVGHPQLSAPPLRVTAAVVNDATALEPDGYGLWFAIVFFTQYRKPKPALSPPDAAIPAAAAPQPTAQDQADKDIQTKLAQVKALAPGLFQ